MINLIFKIVSSIRKLYWFIARPITIGVKILATSDGKVLLIKNRYEEFWYLPGGAIKRGETIIDGARREIKEECRLGLKDLKIFSVYSNFSEYKSDHIILMYVDISQETPTNGFEIEKIGLFDTEHLPENTSPATKRRLAEFFGNHVPDGKW